VSLSWRSLFGFVFSLAKLLALPKFEALFAPITSFGYYLLVWGFLAKLLALPKFEALFAPSISMIFFWVYMWPSRIDAAHLKLWQT
jgi:hypothetical protein